MDGFIASQMPPSCIAAPSGCLFGFFFWVGGAGGAGRFGGWGGESVDG